MSEHLHERSDHKAEALDLSEKIKANLEKKGLEANQSPEVTNEKLNQLQQKVETEAISGKEVPVGEQQKAAPAPSFGAYKELKSNTYKQSLERIRSRLGRRDKVISKVIHQPLIERVSNIAAQTVARPTGIMTAGLIALAGSSFVLFMAKRYGFRYNFTIFILLLVAGYFAGLIIELLFRVIRRRH